MGRKKNTEAILQFINLIGMAGLLSYAMISGEVNNYVHPRFYIGICVSVVILLVFAAGGISQIRKPRHNVNFRPYIIFGIPFIAALFFPANGVSSKAMTVAEGNLSSSTTTYDSNQELDLAEEPVTDFVDTTQDYMQDSVTEEADAIEEVTEKYLQYEMDGVLVIGDDIFADWYDDVYDYLDAFIGKKCQYLAQVYSMDDFEENQFLAGRYFMVCCAADLVGYGMICKSDERSELTDEEWITVTGTITDYQYNGYSVPMLTDVTISEAEAPDVEYIYYNNY